MSEQKASVHNHDRHWKLIITALFEDFVRYYFPELVDLIDFSQPVEFLEQELLKIAADYQKKGTIINDKLVKVPLKSGENKLIYIHIEVQSYRDPEFQERMYTYCYRIRDKYGKNLAPIVIYTGNDIPVEHDNYFEPMHKSSIYYQFNTFLVKDAKDEELLKSKNPFALVVLAAKYLNQSMNNSELRLQFKEKLINLLEERNYSEKQIFFLLTFIEFMLILPPTLEEKIKPRYSEMYKNNANIELSEHAQGVIDRLHKMAYGVSMKERLEKGIEKEKVRSAIKLLKKGLPADEIADVLYLPLKIVLQVQSKLK